MHKRFFFMLVDRFLIYIRDEKRYSKHTLHAYDFDLNQFIEFLESKGILDFHEVNLVILRSYIAFLNQQNLKAVTINRKISAIKKFFSFLVELKEISLNPAKDLKFLKPLKNIDPPLSESEVKKILEMEFDLEEVNQRRDYLIIQMFFFTGIRRAELIGLTSSDILLGEKMIRVRGKGSKTRMIPISSYLADQVEQYMNLMQDKTRLNLRESLFYTHKGNKIYPKFVHNLINSYLSIVSTKRKKSPHVLRHTFATQLLKKGADINSVKELMGHSAISSTEKYTHYNIEELKKVYNHSHPREKNENYESKFASNKFQRKTRIS